MTNMRSNSSGAGTTNPSRAPNFFVTCLGVHVLENNVEILWKYLYRIWWEYMLTCSETLIHCWFLFQWHCGICQRQFHRTCQQCYGHVLEMCHLCMHVFITSGKCWNYTACTFWRLLNQLWIYYNENKLFFNEMLRSTLYQTNTLGYIFTMIAHWNNSLQIDMLLHSDTLSWFWAKHSLLLLLNAAYLAEKQQILIL